jgi:hypothetical protein
VPPQPLVDHAGGEGGAEPEADVHRRIVTGEDGVESVAEDEPVESGGRREEGGAQLAPEPGIVATSLEQQARHPEQRLAHEAAPDAGHDVIVEGGGGGLAVGFPQEAAEEGVEQRLPIAEPRRAREAVVDAALIRMPDLVDAERVLVDHVRAGQVPPEGVPVGAVFVRIDEVPVELIHREDEPTDLESGDEIVQVVLARAPGPVARGGRILGGGANRAREDDGDGAQDDRPLQRGAAGGPHALTLAHEISYGADDGQRCGDSAAEPRRGLLGDRGPSPIRFLSRTCWSTSRPPPGS